MGTAVACAPPLPAAAAPYPWVSVRIGGSQGDWVVYETADGDCASRAHEG